MVKARTIDQDGVMVKTRTIDQGGVMVMARTRTRTERNGVMIKTRTIDQDGVMVKARTIDQVGVMVMVRTKRNGVMIKTDRSGEYQAKLIIGPNFPHKEAKPGRNREVDSTCDLNTKVDATYSPSISK